MLVLNTSLLHSQYSPQLNFKTPYVGIKQLIKERRLFTHQNFKTSYVDIKRNSRIKGLHLDVISKHHMLILNFYIFENEYELNPNFKTSYVDIKHPQTLHLVGQLCISKHHMLILNR